MASTNAIRAFADKVRAASASKASSVILNPQEARNLNHEIEQLLALLVELQSQGTGGDIVVDITGGKF